MDRDGDGVLSRSEVQTVLYARGAICDHDYIDHMFAKYGTTTSSSRRNVTSHKQSRQSTIACSFFLRLLGCDSSKVKVGKVGVKVSGMSMSVSMSVVVVVCMMRMM